MPSPIDHLCRAARRLSVAALGAVVICAAGCFSGFGSNQEPTDFEIGPRGGTFVVTTGALEGLVLEVPPGALSGIATVRVALDRPDVVDPLLVVGPAARIEPSSLVFGRAVTLTLPYEGSLVPLGAGDPVVVRRAGDGVIQELQAASVLFTESSKPRIEVRTSTLGSFWVASPPGAPGLETARYFPLQDGGQWTFEQGVTIDLHWRPEVANIEGGVWVWVLRGGDLELGSYLRSFEGGGLLDLGRESPTLGYQEVLDQPLVLFPGDLSGARRVLGESTSQVYAPVGSTTLAGVGTRALRTELLGVTPLATSMAFYENALEVELLQAWEVAGLSGALRVRLWLAPDIGPVQIRLADGPDLPLLARRAGG